MASYKPTIIAAIVLTAVALGGAGVFVMMEDDSQPEIKRVLTDASDESLTAVTWYVGTEVVNQRLDIDVSTYSGSVPGITFTVVQSYPHFLVANGTPTTAGTYTITTDGQTGTIEITVEQTVVTHTVTFTTSGHGSVSPTSLTVPSGSQIISTNNVITINGQSVTATPDTGYRWISWTNASGTVTADRTITANFEQTETTYSVEFIAGTGGSVSPTIITGVPSGSAISVSGNRVTINGTTVTATPNSGYSFSSWSNTSGTITGDRRIIANFTQDVPTYTVTIVAGTGGSVSHSSVTNVPEGTVIQFQGGLMNIYNTVVSPTASSGYHFVNWTSSTGSLIVNSNMTMTANFAPDVPTYTVTFQAGTGGSVSRTSITDVPEGSAISVSGNRITINGITVTASANSGYTFSSWSNTSGTIIADRTIRANFVQDVQITVGAISPAHGTVTVSSGSSTDEASHGATASISIAAGSSVTWYTVMDSGYVFLGYETEMGSLVSEDNPFTDTVDYDTILLIGESQGGITLDARTLFVDSSSVFYYNEGDVITITDTTSGIYKWSASTKTGIVPFTTTIIETNMTTGAVIGVKEVAFTTREAPDVTVSAIAPAHGTVTVSSGSSSDTASHGATASITVASGSTVVWSATTDTGYAFNGWTRSGTPGTITDNPYTEIAVEDITLTALETSNTITVGAIAPAHGTVTVSSGTSSNSASHGATASITVASGSYVTWNTVMDPGFSFYTYETTSGVPVGDYTTPYSATITVDTTLIVRETVTTLLVTFQAGTGGSVNVSEIRDVPYGSAITVSGQTVTINGQTVTATPDSGYRFDSWSNASGTIIANRTITANFIQSIEYNLDIDLSEVDGLATVTLNGAVVPSSHVYTLASGTPYTLVISNIASGYYFDIWYIEYPDRMDTETSSNPTYHSELYEHTVIQPRLTQEPTPAWWWNDYVNGSVEITFNWVGLQNSPVHQMIIPLWIYNGTEQSSTDDPHGTEQFDPTTYELELTVGYNTDMTLRILDNGSQIGDTYTFKIGYWPQYAILIDAQQGHIMFRGINSLYSSTQPFNFMNYKTVMDTEAIDFSAVLHGYTIEKIYHKDVGTGEHPRFQVHSTTTYLNTYGFVMVDPSINIYEKFPNYNNLRLNFYSFAYYGESVTINGHELPMKGFSQVNLYYIPKDTPIKDPSGQIIGYTTENVISDQSSPDAVLLTTELTNIYVTWTNINSEVADDRVCYLTFVDRNLTINMGTYTQGQLTVSFDGVWFFTTQLYEPYNATISTYEMDWNSWFNLDANAFIILFMIIAGIGFVVLNKVYKPGFLDYIVVGGAGVFSYLLLGGF